MTGDVTITLRNDCPVPEAQRKSGYRPKGASTLHMAATRAWSDCMSRPLITPSGRRRADLRAAGGARCRRNDRYLSWRWRNSCCWWWCLGSYVREPPRGSRRAGFAKHARTVNERLCCLSSSPAACRRRLQGFVHCRFVGRSFETAVRSCNRDDSKVSRLATDFLRQREYVCDASTVEVWAGSRGTEGTVQYSNVVLASLRLYCIRKLIPAQQNSLRHSVYSRQNLTRSSPHCNEHLVQYGVQYTVL